MPPSINSVLAAVLTSSLGVIAGVEVGALELTEIHAKASESVVALRLFDASGNEIGEGTGFAVDGGAIVTNCHVAQPAASMKAIGGAATEIEILGILACDESNDLALLRPAAHRLKPLSLAPKDALPGQRIVVLGNPLGLSGTLSEGIVAAIRIDGVTLDRSLAAERSSPRLQISAPISPGSSGSPVMDLDGRVVAVAASQYISGQNLNFAVPVSVLANFLQATATDQVLRTLGPVASGHPAYLRNLAVSLLLFGVVAYLLFRR
jgi:S1-C subfamily serine protease